MQLFFVLFCLILLGIIRNQIQFIKEIRNPALTKEKDDKGTQTTLVPL